METDVPHLSIYYRLEIKTKKNADVVVEEDKKCQEIFQVPKNYSRVSRNYSKISKNYSKVSKIVT